MQLTPCLRAKSAAFRQVARRNRRAVEKKKRQGELRHAVSLYHLSPSFYPSPAPGSSGSKADAAALDERLDMTIRQDIWGPPGHTHVPGRYKHIPQWHDGETLLGKLTAAARRGPRDGSTDADQPLLAGSTFSKLSQSPHAFSDEAGSNAAKGKTPYDELRESFLSFNDGMTQAPIPPRPTYDENEPPQQHIQPGSSTAIRQGAVDERSARIRDALFGTVGGGDKPGFEVVNERTRLRQQQTKTEGSSEESQ